MSKIGNAFKSGKAFIPYLTAGDPSVEKSCEFILEMERAGADLVEIGIPFSDPIAEGPVIQAANIRALSVHTDLGQVFRLVRMSTRFFAMVQRTFFRRAQTSASTALSFPICLMKSGENVQLPRRRMGSISFP